MGSLQNALASLGKKTLITGQNRIVCEECTQAQGKIVKCAFWERAAIDRGTLSSALVLNLKRFTVDSQGTAANVKLNDHLSFPMVLDMAPYTQGVASCDTSMDDSDAGQQLLYHLVGVIVHKGEASHGHYYSLMKYQVNGTWYKVDDDTVAEFDPANIPAECFGGIDTESKGVRSEKKIRKHNAFVLFYNRDGGGGGGEQQASDGEMQSPSSPDQQNSAPLRAGVDHAVLGLERALAKTNDRKAGRDGSYSGASHPGLVEVMDTNQQVLRRALQFDPDYTDSVLEFIKIQLAVGGCMRTSDILCMGVTVFVRIVLHSADRPNMSEWEDLLSRRIENDATSAEWTLSRASDAGQCRSWVEGILLDCPDERARDSFFRLMLTAARSRPENSHGADKFVLALLSAHANVASSPKYIGSYLSVILGLLRAGGRPAECLHQNKAHFMLAHIVFGDSSPLIGIPRLAATAAGPQDLTDALTCLSLMAIFEPGGEKMHPPQMDGFLHRLIAHAFLNGWH